MNSCNELFSEIRLLNKFVNKMLLKIFKIKLFIELRWLMYFDAYLFSFERVEIHCFCWTLHDDRPRVPNALCNIYIHIWFYV